MAAYYFNANTHSNKLYMYVSERHSNRPYPAYYKVYVNHVMFPVCTQRHISKSPHFRRLSGQWYQMTDLLHYNYCSWTNPINPNLLFSYLIWFSCFQMIPISELIYNQSNWWLCSDIDVSNSVSDWIILCKITRFILFKYIYRSTEIIVILYLKAVWWQT